MSTAVKASIDGSFARHETFTIRYGWLKRAYDLITDPAYSVPETSRPRQVAHGQGDSRGHAQTLGSDFFYRDDDHTLLGVGKNMSRSIRFWMTATQLAEEDTTDPDNGRRSLMNATPFGHALLDDRVGLDPYLEDLGSWWLLHWMLVAPGGRMPVWWSAFHTFRPLTFTADDLIEHVHAQVEATSEWQRPRRPSDSAIKKDVLALLRAYAGSSGSRRRDKADDTIDAPMVPLSLIRPTDEEGVFRFGLGPKPALPPAVVAFACLHWLTLTSQQARTVSTASLASEQGGPGRAFRLTDRDLTALLTVAAEENDDLLSMSVTGGADGLNIVSPKSYGVIATDLLVRHYRAKGRRRAGGSDDSYAVAFPVPTQDELTVRSQ